MSILKVLSAEGISCESSHLGCYVHHNSVLQDIITPLTPDHSISLPSEGLLKITLKTMSEDSAVIGTVVIPLELITNELFWLPLSGDEPLDSIPEITEGPRIKISIEPCEHSCELSPESNIITVSDDEIEQPRLRLQLKMQGFSLKEMASELMAAKEKLKLEESERQAKESKLQETVKEYSQFVSQAQGREKSMLRLLEQKDIEIAENINQTLKLQGYLDRLLEDKRHVEEKLACLKTVAANDETELLRQQVGHLKIQLVQEDKRRQELQEMLLQIGKEWRETEDQEKINEENKLIKVEQEALRSKAQVQEISIELEKERSHSEKMKLESTAAKQELQRVLQEKLECESEIVDLKSEIANLKSDNAEATFAKTELEAELEVSKQESSEIQTTYHNLSNTISSLESEKASLLATLDSLRLSLVEEKRNSDKLQEKIQQEKLYSNRLNDQITQERLKYEKVQQEYAGPDIDSLISNLTSALRMENPILKVGDSYYYESNEIILEKRVEYVVVVKNENYFVPLSDFLSCPRTPAQRKKNSQDSRVENDLESASSCYSIDKDKSMFNAEKKDIKKPAKITAKPAAKIPLRDKNGRPNSISVERRRPFK